MTFTCKLWLKLKTMDILDVLKSLKKLEDNLICPQCKKPCKDPIRQMTCGEYFCKNCINTSSNLCPSCGEYFIAKNLNHDSLAQSHRINSKLEKLKRILQTEQIDENSIVNCGVPLQKPQKNVFRIEPSTKCYHLNFISVNDKLNAKGESLLHVACRKKNFSEVKKLLEQGVDINAKDYAGWAPLHEAVESKSLEIVEILLKNGALVNIPGERYITALHKAASKEDLAMVKLLLKFGANTDAIDYDGLKPLDSTKENIIKEELLKETKDLINVTYELFVSNKIVVYCHSIDDEYVKKLTASKHIKVEKDFDQKKKITHFFIKKSHKLSFKMLRAMLEGLQIVPQDLVNNFLTGEYFVPVSDFAFVFIKELNEGIRRATINFLLKQPPLFHGINFFIEQHTKPINIYNLKVDKEFLTRLIISGGGHVLHRAPALRTCDKYFHPYHAESHSQLYRCCNYIIYDENNPPKLKYNMNELLHRPSKWLIDCIISFKITD